MNDVKNDVYNVRSEFERNFELLCVELRNLANHVNQGHSEFARILNDHARTDVERRRELEVTTEYVGNLMRTVDNLRIT